MKKIPFRTILKNGRSIGAYLNTPCFTSALQYARDLVNDNHQIKEVRVWEENEENNQVIVTKYNMEIINLDMSIDKEDHYFDFN